MLSGAVLPVPEAEIDEARRLLFARHAAMADWPSDHGFALFELHVDSVKLLDWYGGAHNVTAEEYFAAGAARQRSM